jgi:hypothetical protein
MTSGRPTIDWNWVVERLQDADQERALRAIRVHCALRQLDGAPPAPVEAVVEEGRRRLPPLPKPAPAVAEEVVAAAGAEQGSADPEPPPAAPPATREEAADDQQLALW